MDKQFKPLFEQVADKLSAALEAGKSPFQRPENRLSFTIPFNPSTGSTYHGMNAFYLAMQNREDPRWMTKKQAEENNLEIKPGAKPTLINFVKNSDMQAVYDNHGQRVPDENGNPQVKIVELEKPRIANAWLFNGEQIKGLPDWRVEVGEKHLWQPLSPPERVENLVKESGAVVNRGGDDAFYKPIADVIQMPENENFTSPENHAAELLHQMTHWTAHESRLNRPTEAVPGSQAYGREELRANVANLFLSSEMDVPYNFGKHAAYVNNWIRQLKEDPFEIFRASADAQKISDYLLSFDQKREMKQHFEAKQDNAIKSDMTKLQKGDEIDYNNARYKVLEAPKGKKLEMENLTTDQKFKLGTSDNLYKFLLEAKNSPQEMSIDQQQDTGEYYDLQEETGNEYQMHR